MNVTTVDHLELYVGDLTGTVELFCHGFGFHRRGQAGPETGLPGQRSVLLRQGGIELVLTEGVSSEHPAARYVDRHGDGVAVLALRTDAPLAAPVTVPGPGSLSHRLVNARPEGALPAGFVPVPGAGAETGTAGDLLESVDHLALCVPAEELGPTVAAYQEAFGFRQIFQERVEVGTQAMDSKVVQSPSQQVTLTIVAPDPVAQPGQLDDFLRAHDGAGVQHVAFGTSDITAAVRRCGERGVRFLNTPDSYYDEIERRLGGVTRSVAALRAGSILVDRDHWGEMFQIFTRSPFPRRTCFFELIERRGALTFGSNNIKALYEANERARAQAALRP